MRSWSSPSLPALAGQSPPLRLHDTAVGFVRPLAAGPRAGIYVCGITPYDATHMGHAATYVTFDIVGRALRDAGHDVTYVQNVTDIDDPLLKRAARDGIDWTDLATREIDLFREDMADLSVIPPEHYVGVVESMPTIVETVRALVEAGATYSLSADDADGCDVYLDLGGEPTFGSVSGWSREEMLAVFADRGGDPERAGKKNELDPLLWRAARDGEPSWDGKDLGAGRPGWHVECTAIAAEHLGIPFDVQGGGTDLVFPHHEMSAVQANSLSGRSIFARCYAHQEMVAFDGAKMSKSKGNLVLVSELRRRGVDPAAIRLALLAHHYREPWEWTADVLETAEARLRDWRAATALRAAPAAAPVVEEVRAAVADDLDTPRALAVIDRWAREAARRGGTDAAAGATVDALAGRLLGVEVG